MDHYNLEPETEEYDDDGEDVEDMVDQLQAWNQDEDRDTMKRGGVSLGLSRTYVPGWRGAHGFREFYQNWADGIKEANNLEAQGFHTKLEDAKQIWLFKALHPTTGKLLGFIRFTKNKGLVELTNFGTQLSRKTLDLGYTSKRNNEKLAGVHGEGYKVACLVLAREGYCVSFATSSCNWNFRFGGRDKRHLWCYFCPTKDESISRQKDIYRMKRANGKLREPKGNIWEDVTVKIGARGKKGEKVSVAEFLEWIKHCLDLDPPSKIIKTSLGDLILDPKFANRMYLKGLLLEGNPISKKWQVGYNLAQGDVNRDRQKVSDPEEQGQIITGIWDEAFKKSKAITVPLYLKMLRCDTPYPDVDYAEENMSEAMAKDIWQAHLDEDPERKIFYYCWKNGGKDVDVIRKSLKKEALPLIQKIWKPLRKFKLVRTPEEQTHHLLRNAADSAAEHTPYSGGFVRVLSAILALDPRTQDLELIYKCRANAELDLLLDGNRLLINDKWLYFQTSHQVAKCSLFAEATSTNVGIDCFSCGHILTELYDLILVELANRSGGAGQQSSDFDTSMRLKVSESIHQMPCKVEAAPGDKTGDLQITWIHPESEKANRLHGIDLKGRIILHQEST